MTPDHPRSEPRGSPRLARGLGVGVVLLVLGALLTKLVGPSVAHVPSAMAGVRLGSTIEEARGALPALEQIGEFEYRARAVVFDVPATCKVVLASGSRVARIDCLVDPGDARIRERLLVTLRQLYGKESSAARDVWRWQNGRARLELTAATAAPRISLVSNAQGSLSASSQ